MIEYLQGQRRDPLFFHPPFGPLVTPGELLKPGPDSGVGGYDPEAVQALSVMARYVAEFLTSGHAQLGRAGAVCPFTARALDQGLIRLTACAVETPDEAAVATGMESLLGMLDRLDAGGDTARHRAVIAVFPRLPEPVASVLVERVQKALKPVFIARELMIGQFYPGCQEPGLWNPDFRPLQTPVVSLAIRNITIFDAPFMLEHQAWVDAFVRLFGEAGAARIATARKIKDRNDGLRAGACPYSASPAAEPFAEARA